jgi:hypothetical protein
VWDLNKPGSPISNLPGKANATFDFLMGTQQLFVASPNSKVQLYDVVTGRSIPVKWERDDFAVVGGSPNGRTIVGVEQDKSCDSPAGAEQL